MQEIKLEILNWEKFQFRKAVKNPSWFRLENRMWNDQQFFYFSAEERWVWVCLLSLASSKQSATLSVNMEWLSQNSGVGLKTITSALEKLKDNGCLEYTLHARNVQVPVCNPTRHNKTGHNKTEQDKTKTFSIAVKQVSPTMPDKESLDNYFINLSEHIFKIYPDKEFIAKEREKMKLWLSTNQKKSPKSKSGWTRFVMGWLERGWERYRKTINSERAKERGIAEILAEDKKNGFIDI